MGINEGELELERNRDKTALRRLPIGAKISCVTQTSLEIQHSIELRMGRLMEKFHQEVGGSTFSKQGKFASSSGVK